MRRRTAAGIAGAALLAASIAPAGASASFHLMSIREFYPGDSAHTYNDAYVELQMYSPGQNQIQNGRVLIYGPSSAAPAIADVLPGSPVASDENQRTVLMATLEWETDHGASDQLLDHLGPFDPSGGAVCWEDAAGTAGVDCMSYGSFTGSLISPAGNPAAAIPDGMALRRTIAPNCATLLEASDDSNDSATDFSLVAPAPRLNSSAPTETTCGAGGATDTDGDGVPDASDACPTLAAPGTASGCPLDTTPPQTKLGHKPPKRTQWTNAVFRFGADEAATFQCKIDSKPFRPCTSPKRYKRLHVGRHRFQVVATDSALNADTSAARYRWRIVPKG